MQRNFIQSKSSKRRIEALKFMIILVAVSLTGRLFYLQVITHKYYVKLASSQQWAKDVIPAKRGMIYVEDYFNKELYPLAVNEDREMVYVSPEELEDKNKAAELLSAILKVEKDKVLNSFEISRLFVPVKKELSDEEINAVKNLNLKGVYLQKGQKRTYTENSLASQILGYVNNEGMGQYGLEEFYDDILRGVSGLYKAESDSFGRRIAFGKDVSKPAKDGSDIVLTINRDIQAEVENILKESVTKFGAEGGSVIVMDPYTGEIIALANMPTFDPNKFTEVKNFNAFKNRAVTDEFEPGSIFKVITMAAGLDSGVVEPDTKYVDTGQIILDGNKIMNSDKKAHGEQTMTQVLEQSLNTGTTYVMTKLGKQKLYDYIKKFGFGERTGIEVESEANGQVLPPTEREHTYATMSFGQSISTTPLQMINSFASVANGGILIKPHLVKKIVGKDGKVEETKKEEIRRVISEKAAASLTAMLISVVEKGHGKQAKVKGYKVAGKTGTAQVPLPNGGGYDSGRNIGSFIGYAPAMQPRFIVMAKIDSPKGVQWAESTAAPIVGKVLDKLLKYYQIPPTEMKELSEVPN